jgi:hypothetical protein
MNRHSRRPAPDDWTSRTERGAILTGMDDREDSPDAELLQLFSTMPPPPNVRMRAHGVDEIVRRWPGPQPLASGTVIFGSDGRFELTEAGDPAWVMPVWDRPRPLDDGLGEGWADEILDLVAFDPANPSNVQTLLGEPLLGGLEVERASYLREPLRLYGSPLSWLQASGDGAVILDWEHFPHLALSTVDRVICESFALAERLDRVLRQPMRHLPDIRAVRRR